MSEIILEQAVPNFVSFSGDRRISRMNVSKEANAEYMQLLKKVDPQRYAALYQRENEHSEVQEVQVPKTASGSKAVNRRGRPKKYHSNASRQRAYRSRSRALRNAIATH
jgi:hypothetical protein